MPLILFLLLFLTLTTPAQAQNTFDVIKPQEPGTNMRAPVTAPKSYPGEKFPEYTPNDINADTKSTCRTTLEISNTFKTKPITQESVDENGNIFTEIIDYIRYIADKIENEKSFDTPFSNWSNRVLTHNIGNEPANICATGQELERAKKSLALKNSWGSANRSTALWQQKCLKGQRLTRAAISLYPDAALPNNTTNDMEIAKNNGGKCASSGSGTPILLSNVAFMLRNGGYFYDVFSPCTQESKPKDLRAALASAQKAYPSLDAEKIFALVEAKGNAGMNGDMAMTIYRNMPLTDTGSTQRKITVVNIGQNGERIPTPMYQSVPLGAVKNVNTQYVTDQFLTLKTEKIEKDPCEVSVVDSMPDQKNQVGLLAFFRYLWKEGIEIFDQDKTISKPLELIYDKPAQEAKTDDSYRTLQYSFSTLKQQQSFPKSNTSSSDGKDFENGSDEGNIYFSTFQKSFYSLREQQKLGL